jgi:hypothetical protein
MARQVAQRDDKSLNCASAISYREVGTGTVMQKTEMVPAQMSEPYAQINRGRAGDAHAIP